MTPSQRIAAHAQRVGADAVVDGCRALLREDALDPRLVQVLAGDAATWGLQRQDSWLRVWGARGLLWCWGDAALPELRAATTDPQWRVRELACKVVARHRLDVLHDAVAPLRDDPVPRVADAAARALRLLAHGARAARG